MNWLVIKYSQQETNTLEVFKSQFGYDVSCHIFNRFLYAGKE